MSTEPISMVPVPNCDGAARFIPSDRAEMIITHGWLRENKACDQGYDWFRSTFCDSCSYLELRSKLASENKADWENWIICKVGGDLATAGDGGTATAGDGGTATAGDRGTATAGDGGAATAGDGGVISIQYFDYRVNRRRVIVGYIGEGGLVAGKLYRLNDDAQFVEVEQEAR